MRSFLLIITITAIVCGRCVAGSWTDNFNGSKLNPLWSGDVENFSIINNVLEGRNASPVQLLPLKILKLNLDLRNCTVRCRINVMLPNMLICTKGALVLRNKESDGYVFALHVPTKTVEVYRLSNGEMLFSKEESIDLETWYELKAELNENKMAFFLDNKLLVEIQDDKLTSGAVGLGVQDALSVLFDDFSVSSSEIGNGWATVQKNFKLFYKWSRLKIMKQDPSHQLAGN